MPGQGFERTGNKPLLIGHLPLQRRDGTPMHFQIDLYGPQLEKAIVSMRLFPRSLDPPHISLFFPFRCLNSTLIDGPDRQARDGADAPADGRSILPQSCRMCSCRLLPHAVERHARAMATRPSPDYDRMRKQSQPEVCKYAGLRRERCGVRPRASHLAAALLGAVHLLLRLPFQGKFRGAVHLDFVMDRCGSQAHEGHSRSRRKTLPRGEGY